MEIAVKPGFLVVSIALACALPCATARGDSSAAGNIRQQILQGEHDYTYGILRKDIKLLDRVFATDFLDTSATGAVVSVEFVAKGMDQGQPYAYRGRATDVWARISGRRHCVAAHSSE